MVRVKKILEFSLSARGGCFSQEMPNGKPEFLVQNLFPFPVRVIVERIEPTPTTTTFDPEAHRKFLRSI